MVDILTLQKFEPLFQEKTDLIAKDNTTVVAYHSIIPGHLAEGDCRPALAGNRSLNTQQCGHSCI